MTGAARIDIDFRGYWLSGTGGSGTGDADVFAYRDQHRCPAMPMTQVKGILRESAVRIWGADDSRVTTLFGCGDSSGVQQGALRFAGDAVMPDAAWYAVNRDERAALFTILRSTQLSDGIARHDTLRGVEVAVPMKISGVVQCTRDVENWLRDLAHICAATIALGKESHRGLGQAIVSCTHMDSGHSAAFAVPDERRLRLRLACNHPAVFSLSGATEGFHKTLAGPPGSALWGWAIEQCKGDPELLAALLVGKIYFSDAVPQVGDTPVYPRPANLFAPKHEQKPAKWWVGRAAYKAELGMDGPQPAAMGQCHLSADLQTLWRADRQYRLRTAMNDGKAADGQLFGIEAVLAAPDGYLVEIDATNADLNDDQWQSLCAAFFRPLILGKSRNAGFGGEYAPESHMESPYPDRTVTVAGTVMIWALSDLAVVNKWGQLSLPPTANVFGLGKDWKFDAAASTISTRRFAPWDRKLEGRAGEVCVIEAGSVITFRGGATHDLIPMPIGTGRERGFGRWAILNVDCACPPEGVTNSTEKHRLSFSDCLLNKVAAKGARERDTAERDAWIDMLKENDSLFSGGPSRSQWGHVEAALRKTGDVDELLKILGEQRPGCKPLDESSWEKVRPWLFEAIRSMRDWPIAHRQFALADMVRVARRSAPRGKRQH